MDDTVAVDGCTTETEIDDELKSVNAELVTEVVPVATDRLLMQVSDRCAHINTMYLN